MADAYRGLTIEINGETTGLSKALKGINSSLRETQKELNAVNKGLKFDPDSDGLASQKLRVIGDRIGSLHEKVELLRKAEAGISAETKKFADSIGNASRAVGEATQGYAKADAELAKLNDYFRQAALGSEKFLRAVAEDNGLDMANMTVTELRENLKELGIIEKTFNQGRNGMRPAVEMLLELEDELEHTGDEYMELVRKHKAWEEALASTKAARQFEVIKGDINTAKAEMQAMALEAVRVDTQMKLFKEDTRLVRTAVDSLENEFRTLGSAAKIDTTSFELFKKATSSSVELVRTLRTNVDQLETAVKAIGASGNKRLGDPMYALVESAEKAKSEMVELREQISAYEDQIAALAARAEADKALDPESISEAEVEMGKLAAKVEKLEEKYRGVRDEYVQAMDAKKAREMEATIVSLKSRIVELDRAMKGVGMDFDDTVRNFKNAGYGLYSTITPLMISIAYNVVEATERIDSAYRDMRKTVQATEEDYERLYDSAIKYSLTNATSADTFLETEALLAQVGVSLENIQAVAEVVSNLDIATSLNAEELSTQLGQLLNTMQLDETQAVNFGDSLVRLGNNMATTETQIMDVMSYMGSASTMYGFAADEALAWAASISSTGMQAEAAGSAFARVLADIEAAVAQGGDRVAAFASVAQMSATEFTRAWSESPSEAMYALVEGLRAIDDAGGSVESTITSLGFANVRDKQLLKGLTQEVYNAATGERVLADALDMSRNAWNGVSDAWGEAGDAAKEASAKTEGFSGKLTLISNNLDALCEKLGQASVEILGEVSSLIQSVTSFVDGLDTGAVTAAERFVLALAAIGPVAVGVSSVLQAGSTVIKAGVVPALSAASFSMIDWATRTEGSVGKVRTAVGKVGESIGSFANKLTGLKATGYVLGITALVSAVSVMSTKLQESAERAANLTKATRTVSSELSKTRSVVAQVAETVGETSRSYSELSEATKNALGNVDAWADSFSQKMGDVNASIASIEGHLDGLSAVSVGSYVNGADYASASAAVSGLNQSLGTNIELVSDGVGGYRLLADGISVTTSEIRDMASAWEQNARASAYNSSLTDLISQQINLRDVVSETERKMEEVGLGDLVGNLDAIDRLLGSCLADISDVLDTSEKMQLVLDYQDAVAKLGDVDAAVERLTASYLGLYVETKKLTFSGTVEGAKEAREAAEELSDSVADAASSIATLVKKENGIKRYFNDSKVSIEQFSSSLLASGSSVDKFTSDYEAMTDKLRDGATLVRDAWYKDDGTLNMPTAQEYADTLYTNNIDYINWRDSIAALKQQASTWGDAGAREMGEQFVNSLIELGPEYAPLVADFLANESAFQQAAWEYSQAGYHCMEQFIGGMVQKDTGNETERVIEVGAQVEYNGVMDSDTWQASQAAQDLANSILEGAQETLNEKMLGLEVDGTSMGTETGDEYVDGFIAAVSGQETRFNTAFIGLVSKGVPLAKAAGTLSGIAVVDEAATAVKAGDLSGAMGVLADGAMEHFEATGEVDASAFFAQLGGMLDIDAANGANFDPTDPMQKAANAAVRMFEASGGETSLAVDTFFSNLKDSLSNGSFDGNPDFRAQVQQSIDAYKAAVAVGDYATAASLMLGLISQATANGNWSILENATSSSVGGAVQSGVDSVSPDGSKAAQTTVGNVKVAVESTDKEELKGATWTALGGAIQGAVDNVSPDGSKAAQATAGNVKSSVETMNIGVLQGATESVLGGAIQGGVDKVTYVSGAEPARATLANVAASMSEADRSGLEEATRQVVVQAIQAGVTNSAKVNAINPDTGEVVEVTMQMAYNPDCHVNVAEDQQQQVKAESSEIGGYIVEGITQGMTDGQPNVDSMGFMLGHSAVEGVADGAEVNSPSKATLRTGYFVAMGLASGILENVSMPVAAAKYMAQSVIDAVDSYRDQLRATGYYMATGMSEGIAEASSVVATTAANMAANARDAANSAISVASPSKDMIETGRYFAQGFAIGIDRDAYKSAENAASMARSAFDAASVGRQMGQSSVSKLSKADIFDAVSEVMAASNATLSANVYIDSRRLAAATARAYDAELGSLEVRKGR